MNYFDIKSAYFFSGICLVENLQRAMYEHLVLLGLRPKPYNQKILYSSRSQDLYYIHFFQASTLTATICILSTQTREC